MKSWMLCLLLVMAPAVLATETPAKTEAEKKTKPVTQSAEGGAAVSQTAPEPGADEIPPEPPTAEELAGKVESLGEAFTEMKNTVDNLNRMRLTGYIQAQYVNDERSVNELTGAASTRNLDQFSIRRARVKFTYQFAPTSRIVIQPDFGTGSAVSLKDGYVEFTEPWTPWKHTLTAGQFNWPFGFEIMYSSSSREMPERSRVIRTLFPGERDRGIMLSGSGFADRFNYRVGIVNGTGTTQTFDFNKRKDLVGRIGFNLGVIDLGLSGYRGTDLVASGPFPQRRETAKTRQGIDFQWVTPVPGLGTRGEYITGDERGADVRGWYWYLIQNVGTRNQFVVRIDDYDPNTDAANNATRTIGGSYIFHWDANSKVMLTYEQPKLQRNDPDDNVWTLRYQYAF